MMNYIRSPNAQGPDQWQRPAFNSDAVPMPLVPSYDGPSIDGEDDPDDPHQDWASIRRLSRFPAQ